MGELRLAGRPILAFALAAALLGGCSTTRVVPLPAAGVALDPARGTASVESEGVQLVLQPSAWRGNPASLPGYVTPFHVLLVNGNPQPLAYTHADFQLFDEARFQYTALPPAEVERILRSSLWSRVTLAADVEAGSRPILRRQHDPFRDWWWDRWWWPPWPYDPPPRLDDVYLQALPVAPLQSGARVEGFVYFPRLRPGVSRLTLEFHYRLGDVSRLLTVPFGVERAGRGGGTA